MQSGWMHGKCTPHLTAADIYTSSHVRSHATVAHYVVVCGGAGGWYKGIIRSNETLDQGRWVVRTMLQQLQRNALPT